MQSWVPCDWITGWQVADGDRLRGLKIEWSNSSGEGDADGETVIAEFVVPGYGSHLGILTAIWEVWQPVVEKFRDAPIYQHGVSGEQYRQFESWDDMLRWAGARRVAGAGAKVAEPWKPAKAAAPQVRPDQDTLQAMLDVVERAAGIPGRRQAPSDPKAEARQGREPSGSLIPEPVQDLVDGFGGAELIGSVMSVLVMVASDGRSAMNQTKAEAAVAQLPGWGDVESEEDALGLLTRLMGQWLEVQMACGEPDFRFDDGQIRSPIVEACATRLADGLGPEAKEQVIQDLLIVARADGDLSVPERQLLGLFAERIGARRPAELR
jgi:hypothetical protein